MKRTISILLCLVMLLGVLPTAAFATEYITNTTIKLTLDTELMPWFNAQIPTGNFADKISVDSPYSDNLYVASTEWRTYSGSAVSGKFQSTNSYALQLELVAKSGSHFTDTETIQVEGKIPTGLAEMPYRTSYKSEMLTVAPGTGTIKVKIYFYSLTKIGSFDEALTDTTIGMIPVLTAPKLYDSMTAGDVAFKRDAAGHDAYNIDPDSYEVYTGSGIKLAATDKLELDHYYKVRMTLKNLEPGGFFIWSENPEPTVEGPNGPETAAVVGRTADGDPIIEYTYTKACMRKIETLKINGVKAPITGEKPQQSGFTVLDNNIKVQAHAWIDVSADKLMTADDAFVAGQKYRAVLEVTTTRSTYEFALSDPSAVTVSAGTVTAVSDQFDFASQHDTTAGAFVTVEFTASEEPVAIDLGAYTYDMTAGPAPYNEGGDAEVMFWLTLALGGEIGGDGNDNYDLDKDGHLDVTLYEEDGKKYLKALDSANLTGEFVINAPEAYITNCKNAKVDYYSSLTFFFPESALTALTEVEVNVTAPAVGAHPSFTATVPEGANYTATITKWTKLGAPEIELTASDVFEAGSSYCVYVAVTPKDGYECDTATVAKLNGTETNPIALADGALTLKNAYMLNALTNPFTDVKESDYFYDAVLWAANANPQVTAGTSATTFSPNATCTRAQVVTFLWRAKGCPEPQSSSNPFTDVASGEYYYKAVLWAVENEITAGTSATTFSPNAGCTRAQVVTFLWRTEGKPQPTSSSNPFTDVASGEYYYNAVLWAVEKDITKGTSATAFSPNATCTRGQIVTFLYRAFV